MQIDLDQLDQPALKITKQEKKYKNDKAQEQIIEFKTMKLKKIKSTRVNSTTPQKKKKTSKRKTQQNRSKLNKKNKLKITSQPRLT